MIIVDKYAADRAALSASITEWRRRKQAKRLGISYATLKGVETGSTELVSASPWRKLPTRTRRAFKRACSVQSMRRPKKTSEQIFSAEKPNNVPEWYLDDSIAVPPQFDAFRNKV